MRPIKVALQTPNGPLDQVNALAIPETGDAFCVHHEHDGWRVTHVASGHYAPGLIRLKSAADAALGARAFCAMLTANEIDPAAPDLSARIAAHGDSFASALRQRMNLLGNLLRHGSAIEPEHAE